MVRERASTGDGTGVGAITGEGVRAVSMSEAGASFGARVGAVTGAGAGSVRIGAAIACSGAATGPKVIPCLQTEERFRKTHS